ncbi:DNA repair protein RecN [Halioxenophilus sp. WMMB6]|uniref:DNA repair protein RecN n=1 Tax=Halioxenophilus sp. WMMB6 TaxID=3073815 RepID=UPI00295E848E|nr:DNA repair protein RecN [Halioxenophilus sp. WMMB6]
MHLSIQNYTLVEQLDLEIQPGMTAVTGETGAGKSIMLDALGLALGDRGEGDRVRSGAERADISAQFDLSALPQAQTWLKEYDFNAEDDCILRRVITSEGRSRGYINGQAATMSQLRDLGNLLIDIHSQHEHQSLLRRETHRWLLDNFGGHGALAAKVNQAHQTWAATAAHLQALQNQSAEFEQRIQLLTFQVEELDALALQAGELRALEQEQKLLASAEESLQTSHQLAELCSGDEGSLEELLAAALHRLAQMHHKSQELTEAEELLASADIQVREAVLAITRHINHTEINPERLQEVDERLSSIFQTARKHRVQPTELVELHERLQTELQSLTGDDNQVEALAAKEQQQKQALLALAEELSDKRQRAAKKLAKAVNEQLHLLAMASSRFEIALQPVAVASTGLEVVEFLISTNPGAPAKPLTKVASGGELSRISLAIVVVTAQTSSIPTMVFDEVDVGIGGATADVVGNLLRGLGESGQVIVVTHLGQVAARAHHHLQVSKLQSKRATVSTLRKLEGEEKISEIARMIGGTETAQSLAHAKEMLEKA